MEKQNFYQILGVEKDAGSRQIKTAYRELALKYHPDRNRDNPVMADRMKAVNEAYAVLSNPEKRREYDLLRKQFGSSANNQFRKSYSQQDIFSGSDINRIFEELSKASGLRGFDEVFREFYGPGYHSFEFKRPGVFAKGFIYIGGRGRGPSKQGSLPLGGNLGKLPRYLQSKISGVRPPQNGSDIHDIIRIDLDFARSGGPFAYFLKQRSKKLVVKIPPHIKNGQKIRLTGMGTKGKHGGKPGDLFLKVKIQQPLFQKIKTFISGHHP